MRYAPVPFALELLTK